MSRVNESYHVRRPRLWHQDVVWKSHIARGWVMSRVDESCHISIRRVTCGWVMSRTKTTFVAPKRCENESCRMWMGLATYEWVISHTNESCHVWISHVTCEWVMSHAKESFRYEWVMSHINESCHVWIGLIKCQWVRSHVDESSYAYMSHVTLKVQVRERNIIDTCRESHVRESCHMWMGHVTCA